MAAPAAIPPSAGLTRQFITEAVADLRPDLSAAAQERLVRSIERIIALFAPPLPADAYLP